MYPLQPSPSCYKGLQANQSPARAQRSVHAPEPLALSDGTLRAASRVFAESDGAKSGNATSSNAREHDDDRKEYL